MKKILFIGFPLFMMFLVSCIQSGITESSQRDCVKSGNACLKLIQFEYYLGEYGWTEVRGQIQNIGSGYSNRGVNWHGVRIYCYSGNRFIDEIGATVDLLAPGEIGAFKTSLSDTKGEDINKCEIKIRY